MQSYSSRQQLLTGNILFFFLFQKSFCLNVLFDDDVQFLLFHVWIVFWCPSSGARRESIITQERQKLKKDFNRDKSSFIGTTKNSQKLFFVQPQDFFFTSNSCTTNSINQRRLIYLNFVLRPIKLQGLRENYFCLQSTVLLGISAQSFQIIAGYVHPHPHVPFIHVLVRHMRFGVIDLKYLVLITKVMVKLDGISW